MLTTMQKRPPKSLKNEMFVFGLRSTSDDQPSNLSSKRQPKHKEKTKKAPYVIKNKMFISGLHSTSDDWPSDLSNKRQPKHQKMKKGPICQ